MLPVPIYRIALGLTLVLGSTVAGPASAQTTAPAAESAPAVDAPSGPITSEPLPPGPPTVREGPTTAPAPPLGIGRAVYVGDELLTDYRPVPALSTDAHAVDKPKFPAVDVHCHWSMQQSPEQMLAAMDDLGVRRSVNLSGGWGDDLFAMLDRFAAVAPDRLIVLASIDYDGLDDPGYGERAAAFLEAAHARGARGLKVWKNLGLTLRDASGELVQIDDPRLDPIWAKCGELGMPVLIHSADPTAFFAPTDARNERWMQLQRHPGWSFFGPQFPTKADVLAQRDRMIAKHPATNFIGAHVGDEGEDLRSVAARLDALPNLSLDISGRVSELGRQPYSARAFLIKYQDRVLFGTDRYPGRPDQPRHRIYYRFLETADEHFDYYDHPFPPSGDWKIYGVFLPDEALRKIYHENADRLLGFAGE